MKVDDELIACYVDGNAGVEEQKIVRQYLCEHTEEYEHILCLMDNDTFDYLGEQLEICNNCVPMNEKSYSDIAYSAAAFAPEQNKLFIPKHNSKSSKTSGLYDRLINMSDEIDNIL